MADTCTRLVLGFDGVSKREIIRSEHEFYYLETCTGVVNQAMFATTMRVFRAMILEWILHDSFIPPLFVSARSSVFGL